MRTRLVPRPMAAHSQVAEAKNPGRFSNWGPRHNDLRDWLERCEEIGELIRLKGVDWNPVDGPFLLRAIHDKSAGGTFLGADGAIDAVILGEDQAPA